MTDALQPFAIPRPFEKELRLEVDSHSKLYLVELSASTWAAYKTPVFRTWTLYNNLYIDIVK